MKKWTTALLIWMMLFLFVGCGKENKDYDENKETVSTDTAITNISENSNEDVSINETADTETIDSETTIQPTETPTPEPSELPTDIVEDSPNEDEGDGDTNVAPNLNEDGNHFVSFCIKP